MASGVMFGARFCCRAYASSFCYSSASRINVRYLRRCRKACIANAIEYLMQENFRNTTVDIDDSSFTDFEGEQDNEDPSMQMMMERYEKYRLWLANLMGKDPESFDQEAVQEAIEYLLPSGLYAKDCRPTFEHPQSVYRQSTDQSFKMDKHGRPLAAAFYTGQVAFHDLLFEIYELTAKLNALDETAPSDSGATEKGDILTSGDDTESQSSDVDSAGSSDSDSSAGEDHSSSSDESESQSSDVDSAGSSDSDSSAGEDHSSSSDESDRKNAVARVWVKKGSGQVTVNDVPFVKKQIMSPFLAINAVGDYDVRSEVLGGGHSGQSGAIRLAISRALLNFEDSYLEPLEEAHLLIRDPRIKERKKPGQMRARRKFAWVKR
ncbi:28S ribosomal protein S9, mitochondrial [Stylophora pistillata]|uniref:28S ribosomal protein S9, mitochondrial n=1 Tax=Stylophora pistillata TaxID=50429 RepID=A0A2B4SXL9_STYPI|nr:28S ribosomal protein S9, mitochondrial [Stylophora pistillata]